MKSYCHIDGEYEFRCEIKRSLFIATVKGELDEEGAEAFVRAVRKRYPDATHNCYAYISDELGNMARFSDDGEPSGTAGQPILDVLKKQGLRRSAIVVTRYFGGIKLGAGGLVGAYSGTAAQAVKLAKISTKRECFKYIASVDYTYSAQLDKLARALECIVEDVNYDDGVKMTVYVPIDSEEKFLESVRELSLGSAQTTTDRNIEYR